MIACVDVHYREEGWRAALLLFDHWTDAVARREVVEERATPPADYVPGEFYRRELDAILSITAPSASSFDTIVIDGYVRLDDQGRKGLGAWLREALNDSPTVIGVAKTRFQGAGGIEVLRGDSARPLIVTASGISDRDAADAVRAMHGKHRVPTLLRRVDYLARHGRSDAPVSE